MPASTLLAKKRYLRVFLVNLTTTKDDTSIDVVTKVSLNPHKASHERGAKVRGLKRDT